MAYPISKQIDLWLEAQRDDWITDHGDSAEILRAEIAVLDRLKKACDAKIKARRTFAIEEGFAYNKQVWTNEHVVQGHFKNRFTWVA